MFKCLSVCVVHSIFCIHICSFFYEKLADDQATSFWRPMQRSLSTMNNRMKTLQTKQLLWMHFCAYAVKGRVLYWSLLWFALTGSAIRCSKTRSKLPAEAAVTISALPAMRTAAAACKQTTSVSKTWRTTHFVEHTGCAIHGAANPCMRRLHKPIQSLRPWYGLNRDG